MIAVPDPWACPNAAEVDGKLFVEIAAPHDAAGNVYFPHGESFEVRFLNRSDQPILIWDEKCELGHATLTFDCKMASGDRLTARERQVPTNVWKEVPLETVAIAPGKTISWMINWSGFFWGRKTWEDVPEPNTGENTELKAVFEVKPTEEGKKRGVWTGRIESASLVAPVTNPRLKTPQDYLWNNCPRQALRMLKEDPAWINNQEKQYQCTPLHHAARFGYKEVVLWLIEHGAGVNIPAYNGFTPLHLAEQREIAKILIDAGANLDQKNNLGKTALQAAAETRRQGVVDAILASGYKTDLYTILLLKRRDLALKMLIEDPNIFVGGNMPDDLSRNATPLGLAAEQGDLELAKLLIEAGAPVNDPTRCVRFGGYATPLCNAVWAGRIEMVEFLLEKEATTDVVGGKFFATITEFAEQHSDKRIVALLKKHQKKANIVDFRDVQPVKNRLPSRIKSGEFKLPNGV